MNSRGRPFRNTSQVKVMLTNNVLSELRSCHPELMKPGSTTFRHGKLAQFIEHILWKELRGKPKYVSSQINSGSGTSGESTRNYNSGDSPGSGLRSSSDIGGRHGPTGGELGSVENGDWEAGQESREER